MAHHPRAIARQTVIDTAWTFPRGQAPAAIGCTGFLRDGQTTVNVAHTGTGFHMRHHHRLFTPFQRRHHAGACARIGLVTMARLIARQGAAVPLTLPAEPRGAG